MTLVLGLDPGTRHFGWGVVEREGTRLVHGRTVSSTPTRRDHRARLVVIERELVEVLSSAWADAGQRRGALLREGPAGRGQARARPGRRAPRVRSRGARPSHEYPPALVKRAVTGSGRADKAQVAQMVRVVLALSAAPPADAADALAVAIVHLQRAPMLAAAASFRRSSPAAPTHAVVGRLEEARPERPMHLDERTNDLLGPIFILSDLLIFLSHLSLSTAASLRMRRRPPARTHSRR
jgi:crossover junction endodeoxyribonuclease RuvC